MADKKKADKKKRAQDAFIYHEVGLQNLSSGIVKKIDQHLKAVQGDLLSQIVTDFEWATKTPARMRELRRTIAEIQREAHKALRKDLSDELIELASYETDWAHGYHTETIEVAVAIKKPSANQLRAFVTAEPFQGRILNDWARKMERNQVERINTQIVIGMTEGEGIGEIISRLQGSRDLKFRDGRFAKDRRSAEALVRTAVNHVANQAHAQMGKDHPDEFPRYRWSSVLDSRTTPICRSRGGNIYRTGEGPLPPAHWNCRSKVTYISAYNTWEEEEPTYGTWLKDQPRDIVEDALGKKRADLYIKGKLSIDKFTNQNGHAWTLDELRRREKNAWKSAFGG